MANRNHCGGVGWHEWHSLVDPQRRVLAEVRGRWSERRHSSVSKAVTVFARLQVPGQGVSVPSWAHAGPGLAAHTCQRAFERDRPRWQDARGGTCRAVVSQGVQSATASTRMRQPQPPQQQHPELRMVTSSWVGNTVGARAACGPACESSSACDARDRFPKCVASARSAHAWAACLCQPRMKFECPSSFPAGTSRVSPHAGASYPWACR